MKELIKYIYVLLYALVAYGIYHFVGMFAGILFLFLCVLKNQIDIEEKVNEIDDKKEKEKELWKAILPTRKRF